MRNIFAYPIMLGFLVLVGCSKLDTPESTEESCDLCHTTHLNKTAVHRIHLSNLAMATFPFKDNSEAARMTVINGTNDTTFKYKVDTSFKFSNSATIDKATHYQQTRLLNLELKCTDCHKELDSRFIQNNDGNHRNGIKDASFNQDMLRQKHYNPNGTDTAHYTNSVPGAMRFDGDGCNNILCHGAGRKGVQNVIWNTSAKVSDTLSCMSCHETKNHKVGVTCDKCHYDVTLDNGKTIHNFRKHLNDTINYGKY